jgi:hypothetical protein
MEDRYGNAASRPPDKEGSGTAAAVPRGEVQVGIPFHDFLCKALFEELELLF